jgi:hypothetical protein
MDETCVGARELFPFLLMRVFARACIHALVSNVLVLTELLVERGLRVSGCLLFLLSLLFATPALQICVGDYGGSSTRRGVQVGGGWGSTQG